MSDEESVGGLILGLFFGGVFLVLAQMNISTDIGVNLALWGSLFIVVAILLGGLVIVSIVSNIVGEY